MNKNDFRFRKLAAAIVVGCAIPAASFAAVDMFLKLDTIQGDVTAKGHENEIQVYSWSWGVDHLSQGTAAGSMAGRPCVTELNLVKPMDKASTKLMGAVVGGQSVGKGKLTMRKSGEPPQDFFTFEMASVQVSSVQVSGSGELPMESVSLRFPSATATYTPQNADGKAGAPIPVMIKAATC
jgi:type VI secretion system secreted protein Hcp